MYRSIEIMCPHCGMEQFTSKPYCIQCSTLFEQFVPKPPEVMEVHEEPSPWQLGD